MDDAPNLEKIQKLPIILKHIAGEDINNSGKYRGPAHNTFRKGDLICHNGNAWSKNLHFPKSHQGHIYKGDVWEAIRLATHKEPLAV